MHVHVCKHACVCVFVFVGVCERVCVCVRARECVLLHVCVRMDEEGWRNEKENYVTAGHFALRLRQLCPTYKRSTQNTQRDSSAAVKSRGQILMAKISHGGEGVNFGSSRHCYCASICRFKFRGYIVVRPYVSPKHKFGRFNIYIWCVSGRERKREHNLLYTFQNSVRRHSLPIC